MLSRAVKSSFKNQGLRKSPAAFRIASSTVWSRSLARSNRPNPGQKKPTDYSRPPGAQPTSAPGGASVAFNSRQDGQNSIDRSERPDSSTKQDEVSKGASPERNAVPQSSGLGAQAVHDAPKGPGEPDVSSKQAEFETASSPQSSPSPADAPRTQPLPDLTKGIPSTLEYEAMGSTKRSLNLTEADEPEPAAGGGRGRGELPASAYVSSSEKRRLRFANYMYALFAGLSVTGTLYLGRNWESEEEENAHPESPSGWGVGLMWNRASARLGDQVGFYTEPAFQKLLPDVDPMFERPYTLVLSLEDLLIHSEWSREHGWRMAKRPGMDYFLRYLSQYYELVIFTSQPFAIAEPIIRKLDPFHIVTWPLFREATRYENGEYVKDLSFLNRDLSKVILMDTVAAHAKNQPENAIILNKWKGNVQDKELISFIPFLEYIHTMAYSDVRKAIKSFEGTHIPTEFAKREAIARKKFQEQIEAEKKKAPKHSGMGFLGNALGIKHQSQMMDPADQTPAEAFAQGKMLQDQARERGQRNYELLEKEIRENGEKWLKEEAAVEEKAKEEAMKAMKTGFTGFFGGK